MTGRCLADSELDRLLADELTKEEEEAMEVHVARCSDCQHRLERLTRVELALTVLPAGAEPSRTETNPNACMLEQVANIHPAQVHLFAQQHIPERESEAARYPQTRKLRSNRAGVTFGRPDASSAQQSPFMAPPSSFGRYEVRRLLGAGGSGSVYLAHDRQLDRPVAIKVFHGGADTPPTEGHPLLQEACRLAQLHHPAIVAVHDAGVHEGRFYVVSDFVDGPSLKQWLRGNRPSWQDAAGFAAAVADALAHAHSRLTIHRDVKPDNIVLAAGRTPVLVDFGLALDQAHAGDRELGVVAGTPWYMSPEQVAGVAHRIDGRTDIYSLGVVLYEMLCGRVPFRADQLGELLRQVSDDEPQPPRQLVPTLPPELERVCFRALAKRPHDRYSTAADMAAALRGVIQAVGPIAASSKTTQSPLGCRDPEHRQVTILVCGCTLFDSVEYVGIDGEDQAQVLRSFQQICRQAARRFEGAILQCNQQGLLVCFGYPVTYEDSACRAARTGLDILDNLNVLGEQLGRSHRLELGPWVGIHTGPAFVETSEDVVSLAGEAPNVAVRLKDVAQRGQIVCTETTHRLIRNQFECACLGNRKVNGGPIALFAVRTVIANAREAEGKLTALVGRDHEVNLLLDRWEQAREGMGQVVLLVGEPGLGKSRLVQTLKSNLQGQPDQPAATVIEWHCSPYRKNALLYPARDFLERLLGSADEESPITRLDGLICHLAEHGMARPEVVPLFATLLSLPADERFPALGVSPLREREEMFRALQEWLCAHTEKRLVLFVVEDLHWVDASTLEFLRRFLAEGMHERVLTLLTFRPEFQAPWPALAHQTSLALNRLTHRQVGEMMRENLGIETLPEALVASVYDRTGGVPLFVEEFTKVVREWGLVERMGDDGAGQTTLAHEVPESLQDLMMARLDRLAVDRMVIQLAATLGREFSYDLLAAAAKLDEPTLRGELAKLVQGEILDLKGRWPKCRYVFRHALLQESVYKTLVKSKRQRFHGRIAEVLETQLPETAQSQPELLAHHCTEAGLIEKAIGYWFRAGQQSRQRWANIEAISQLTEGLALLAKLPDDAGRDVRELEFSDLLGSVYIAAQGYAAAQVGPILRRSRELCERLGQPVQLFTNLRSAWVWHTVRGNSREQVQLAHEASVIAERMNDAGILMEALCLQGVTSYYRGRFADARADCARAVADYDNRERTRFWAGIFGEDSGIVHRCFLALSLWHLGHPDQALKGNQEMLHLARAIGEPSDLCLALIHKNLLFRLCRLPAADAADEAIQIATEKGLAFWLAAGRLLKAAALLLGDQRAQALLLFQNGLAAYRASGFRAWLPFHLSILGDAYTQAGRLHEAAEALDEGLVIAEQNDERFHEAELHRLKGELLLAASPDQPALAEGCFLQAIHISRHQQSWAWELRATTSLARLWLRQGRRDAALATLAVIHGAYTEGFTTPDLTDAAALSRFHGHWTSESH